MITTATEFLQRFHPNRVWLLTCIGIDNSGIETKHFPANDTQATDAEAWVVKWDGKRNIHYSVAEPLNNEDKKAERANIRAVHYLHVDVDPDKSKDLAEEQTRLKELVTFGSKTWPKEIPDATVRVFSGGGYQLFWELDQETTIDGNLVTATEAASYNKGLEVAFGADSCSNIDRVMRLPFTVNIPNKAKLAAGRTRVMAKIVGPFGDNTIAIEDIKPCRKNLKTPGTTAVDISKTIARLKTVDDLDKWLVPTFGEEKANQIKTIIVQGHDPDEPKERDNSRSAWVFDATCQMIRANVPDDVVYSVLTDQGFKISESILENPNPDKYAKKQISSAKTAAISPTLHELNSQYSVIKNIGGKCRVIEEVYDTNLDRYRLVKQTTTDFATFHQNRMEMTPNAKGELKPMELGKWWLKHPQRRSFDRIEFDPSERVGPDVYNLWQGFGFKPIPGTRHEPFLKHIRETICCGNEEHYKYILKWMANTVQNPARPGMTAIVMRGKPGTGKGFFAKHFGKLFNRHFLPVTNAAHLTGNFNHHLRDAVVVFGDECFDSGHKQHESVLKVLITEDTIQIEAKGIDVETSANFVHLLLATNSDWAVPVGPGDRRYFIIDIDDKYARNRDHFGKLESGLKEGGYENLLHFLMELDLTDFDVEKMPDTDAKKAHREHGMSDLEKLIRNALMTGICKWEGTANRRGEWCFTSAQIAEHLGNGTDALDVGNLIGKKGLQWPTTTMHNGNQRFIRPPMAEGRKAFDKLLDTAVDWPKGGDWVTNEGGRSIYEGNPTEYPTEVSGVPGNSYEDSVG